MNSNIVINENSQKKEIAELFLRFCASEDAGKVFSEEANASSPYTYKNPVSSEYQWINSVNRIMLNPYLKQIQNEERGVKETLSGATLFPKLGEYFAVSVYQQLVTKYNDNYSIVGNDSVYTNAASQALKNEYDYVKDRFDKGTWKI